VENFCGKLKMWENSNPHYFCTNTMFKKARRIRNKMFLFTKRGKSLNRVVDGLRRVERPGGELYFTLFTVENTKESASNH
jgi:hypothetical protein